MKTITTRMKPKPHWISSTHKITRHDLGAVTQQMSGVMIGTHIMP